MDSTRDQALIGNNPATQLAKKAIDKTADNPSIDPLVTSFIEGSNGNNQDSSTTVTVVAEVSQSFRGPLPMPSVLAGYEQAIPGAGERIMKWAEAEQQHRHSQERWKLRSDIGIQCTGLLFAGTVAIGGTACGTYLIAHGQALGGGAVVFSSLATIILGVVHAIKVVRAEREDLTKIEIQNPEKNQPNKTKKNPNSNPRKR